ncbi:MAG: caspase family protein [Treponema sp.]|nr:caspase family protein [Treponema sp.]
MRKLCGIFIAILLSLPMFSEARNALLIANGNYSHFGNLSTPIKEARDLKISLTQLGFSVTIVENASREKILDSLSDFEKILKSKGGIALFHYGGHAVQVNGRNYLIPANADIPDERRVATRAVDVDELMHSMVADTNIVILDSCRNNPLPASSTRDGTRGLVMATNRPRNSIIVYSAQAGKTAKDGIFTPTLTKKILEKKSFTDILMDVRREVRSVTKNEQSPCEYNELEMNIYLAGYANKKAYSDDEFGSVSSTTISTSSSQWLFPVYDLELGTSTKADVKKKSEGSVDDFYFIKGHIFNCIDSYGRDILDGVCFISSAPWPQEIINKGYNPNYSYNQWKSFLISQGYTIIDSKSHILQAYKNTPIKHTLGVFFKNDKTDSLQVETSKYDLSNLSQ